MNPKIFNHELKKQAAESGCSELQWYWIGVIFAGHDNGLIAKSHVMDINPVDHRVAEAMNLCMPVDEAAKWIFQRSH